MRHLLLLVLLFATTISFGQKLRFSYPGNRWISDVATPDCRFRTQTNYHEDTVVYGKTYQPITVLYISIPFYGTICGSPQHDYLIREDTINGYVYYRDPGFDTVERILYNYNLIPGDTIHYERPASSSTDSVVSIDSTLINGIWHKVLNMHNTGIGNGRMYSVVEGIGCTNGPLFPVYFVWCFEYEERLLCFSRDTIYPAINASYTQCGWGTDWDPDIYTRDSFVNSPGCIILSAQNLKKETPTIAVTPNPASDYINIVTDIHSESPLQTSIHNITGNCIYKSNLKESTIVNTTLWPAGLYIISIQNREGILKREKILITH